MRRAATISIGLLSAIFAPLNNAEVKQTVYVQVTKVVPQLSEPSAPLPAICSAPKPHPDAGLSTILTWELAQCIQAPPTVEGYRVYYQWDGRTYSRLTATQPGKSIPLQISIR